MKILQLIENTNINHIHRYVNEMSVVLSEKYPDSLLSKTLIFDDPTKQIVSKEKIDFINEFNYLFIHSIPNNDEVYSKIIKNVKVKKILFIHEYSVGEFYYKKNKKYIHDFLLNCYKICVYEWNKEIINEIKFILGQEIFDNKIVYTNIIYNFNKHNWIPYKDKKQNMIFINHNDNSNKLCGKYIDLYKTYKQILQNVNVFNILGVSKNVQSINVNDLFVNTKTGDISTITHISKEITDIDKDKLNVSNKIDYDLFTNIVKHSLSIVDLSNALTYGMLDSINDGTLLIVNPILLNHNKIFKNISLSSYNNILTDVDFDKIKNILNDDKKYNENIELTYKIFSQLLNPITIIENLLKHIE